MPRIMNNLNNIDPFIELIKSKLADYEAEVAPEGWERIESSLFVSQRAKVVRTKWIASSVAAVAAAMIGVFFVFQTLDKSAPIQTSDNQLTEYQIKAAPSIIEESTKSLSIEKQTKAEKLTSSLIADNSSSNLISQSVSKEIDSRTTNNETTLIPSDKKEKSTSIKDKSQQEETEREKEKLSEIDEETQQRLIEDFINKGNEPLTLAEINTRKSNRKSRNSVSVVGQSGLISSQYTNRLPNTLRSSVSDTYGTYTLAKMQAFNDEEEIEPESETTHNQPVSFGLLTSFALTQKLQIETGVVYTYLSSETKSKSSDFQNSERVQFHYLGVPLNLNYSLLSINKLNLFVTAGGMIEKDINGKIKYNDEKKVPTLNSGYASNSSSKIKQKNPQLSVAAGLGITYPIYEKANLFGKVGGRYYIHSNNEYKTYYSDEKIGLDIQVGIKFNF